MQLSKDEQYFPKGQAFVRKFDPKLRDFIIFHQIQSRPDAAQCSRLCASARRIPVCVKTSFLNPQANVMNPHSGFGPAGVAKVIHRS